MWVVFDIGNSSIKGGLFEDHRLEHTFTLPHDAAGLASGLRAELNWERGRRIDRAGIASVVPETTERLSRLLHARELEVTTVHHRMRLPFELRYRTPETLGTDRLAAAAAAWAEYGRKRGSSVVALDAGTAFTYEVIDRRGVYLGGTIAPGPALMQRALNRETAQLPDVPLELPETPLGRSTTEAMQAGIMFGFIESVRGLLRRINEMLGEEAVVVATGGWSRLLMQHVDEVDEVDAHLVLRGIRILMEMNAGSAA